MQFDDHYKYAFQSVLDVFGEYVEYYFSDGSSRKMSAVIDREQMAVDSNDIPVRLLVVTISSDPSKGVPQDKVDIDDAILLEKVRGQEPQLVRIMEVQSNSGNVTTLFCK
jgi:hypothetical protein